MECYHVICHLLYMMPIQQSFAGYLHTSCNIIIQVPPHLAELSSLQEVVALKPHVGML